MKFQANLFYLQNMIHLKEHTYANTWYLHFWLSKFFLWFEESKQKNKARAQLRFQMKLPPQIMNYYDLFLNQIQLSEIHFIEISQHQICVYHLKYCLFVLVYSIDNIFNFMYYCPWPFQDVTEIFQLPSLQYLFSNLSI